MVSDHVERIGSFAYYSIACVCLEGILCYCVFFLGAIMWYFCDCVKFTCLVSTAVCQYIHVPAISLL